MSKNDEKDLFLIYQCVNPNIFEKIIEEETTKGAQDTLKKLYESDEKLKKVRLQFLKKQLEKAHMNDSEAVADFFSRLVFSTN